MATVLKFRNYKPSDPSLRSDAKKPKTVDAEMSSGNISEPAQNIPAEGNNGVVSMVAVNQTVSPSDVPAESVDAARNIIIQELDKYDGNTLNVVPKVSNWDLKSMYAKKLDKLNRRTQRAIVDILREKLQNEEDSGTDNETGVDE